MALKATEQCIQTGSDPGSPEKMEIRARHSRRKEEHDGTMPLTASCLCLINL